MDIVNGLRGVKRTVAGFSLAALIASTFAIGVAQAQTFPDVNPSDWFYSYVEDLVAQGVINGSMPEYRPTDYVNRAEMAKLVVEAFEIDLVSPAEPTFKDVAVGTWYYEYVETAAAHGIVGGYKDTEGTLTGYYGPGDYVTREQAAKMIVLGAPLDINTNCGPSFESDVPLNKWSYEYVETLYVNSVVDGYPDGTFGPEKNINRAEIAKIVSNAMSPVLRPCGEFSVVSAKAMSGTTVEVCYTNEYDETSAMMAENYMVEDQDGNELAVTNVEATSDPECVLLTTDAQDGTKVYDLMVSDVMSADGMELLNGSATFNGYTVGNVGDLTVRVDGSTPAAASIPNNAANVLYTVFNIEAGSDEAVRIEELTITRQGLGLPGDFDAVKLYVDGVQKGSEKTINTSSNSATFALSGDPIVVPAGSSVLVEARGDMAGQVNSQNALCISSSDSILAYGEGTNEEVPVSGSFSVCGNYMSTTSATVGAIEYEIDDYSGDINVGDMDVSVARLKVDVNHVEDVDLTRVSFRQRGSADPEDFANATLYVSGSALDVVGTWEDDYLTFDLSEAPLFIERGNSKTIELRVDVVGGLGNDVEFDIYRDWHIEGTGRVYGYGVNVAEVSPAPVLAARDIIGGNLAFALSSNNPTVGDVAAGGEDHVFMTFNMSTGGDGITMRGFRLDINYGGASADNAELQDVKVWRKNTAGDLVVVAGPLDPASGVLTNVSLNFNDSFDQAAGLTTEYYVTADVENSAPNGATYSIDFDTSTVDAEYLSNGDAVAGTDITGGILNGKTQTVADPTLDVALAGIPRDKFIVGGQQEVEIANWNLQASSASDIKVNSLALTCYWTELAGSVDSCTDVFTNLKLYLKDGSTMTLLQSGKSLATGDPATVTFNNVNLLIPAGNTAKVALIANTTTSADAADFAGWNVVDAGDVLAEDEQGNTLPAVDKTADGGGGFPGALRIITFVGAGTLTVEVAGDTPTDDALLGGANDQFVTRLKFTADANEDIEIQKLRLTDISGLDVVANLTLMKDGAEIASSAMSSNRVEFTGLSILVPADGSVSLDVYADVQGIGSGLAYSSHTLQVVLEEVDAGLFENLADTMDIKAVGKSSGQLLGDAEIIAGFGYTSGEVYDGAADVAGLYTVYRTLPTLTKLATPNGGIGQGTVADSVLEFDYSVEGPAGRTGTITNISFNVTGTCAGGDVSLYDGATPLLTATQGDGDFQTADFVNGLGVQVSTGSTKKLTMKVDGSGCSVDESLGLEITGFDYDDDSGSFGSAPYNANTTNQFFNYDLSPVPLTDSIKY